MVGEWPLIVLVPVFVLPEVRTGSHPLNPSPLHACGFYGLCEYDMNITLHDSFTT